MLEPGNESLKDMECLKENFSLSKYAKKYGILHRIQC